MYFHWQIIGQVRDIRISSAPESVNKYVRDIFGWID
jgi:hypothetical protein